MGQGRAARVPLRHRIAPAARRLALPDRLLDAVPVLAFLVALAFGIASYVEERAALDELDDGEGLVRLAALDALSVEAARLGARLAVGEPEAARAAALAVGRQAARARDLVAGSDPAAVAAAQRLSSLAEAARPALVQAGGGARRQAIALQLAGALDDLDASRRQLRADGEARRAALSQRLRTASTGVGLATVAAVLCLSAAGARAMTLLERSGRLAAESARHAAEAEAAERVKSRFLTMMSHELRTPMNGVMGMLALLRQTSLTDGQARMVDQARRAGGQLVAVLADLLDLTELQSERLAIRRRPVALAALAARLREHATALGDGPALSIEVARGERTVEVDPGRIARSVSHLVGHLSAIGCSDVVIRLDHGDSRLSLEIDVDAEDAGAPGWRPEQMFDRSSRGADGFATDALAPLVARGLITEMGGELTVERRLPGRASIRLAVPADALEPDGRSMRIEVGTGTLAHLVAIFAADGGWRTWAEGEDAASVTAIVVDDASAGDRIAWLRERHPAAGIVALGRPGRAAGIDGLCPLPVTRRGLVEALEAARARAGGQAAASPGALGAALPETA